MEPKDRIKEVTFSGNAHADIHAGVEIMRQAVGSTYGPGGRNVMVQKKYVHPVLTRDGVTVARDIAGHGNKLPNVIAGEAAKLVYQASEKTNKTAGDGTTATVVLLAELYKAGYKRTTAGEDPMVIKRMLDRDRDTILQFVESKSVKATKDKLDQVAYISSGDQALGSMISDLVWDVGADGAITISYQNAPNVQVEKVTGYLFNQGFRHLQGEAELDSPLVIVSQKRIAARTDIIPILEIIAQSQKQFILIADVSGAAMDTLVGAIVNSGKNGAPMIDGVSIPPVAFGADGQEYFEDVAIYTGARVIMENDSFKDITLDWFGKSKAVRVSREKAIIYGDNSTGDAIAERIKLIKDQMDKLDMTPSLKETLEQRYAKLAGKVSIIKVGAATEVEREELFFRVEDAVEACKSALSSGIVAGGATTLLFASTLRKDTKKQESVLESFVKEALQQPFRLLMSNAAEDGGYRLNQVLEAGYGKGFNLRDMTSQPVDLLEAGIIDATKVVTQTVKNAFSVAGALLTTGSVVTEIDHEPAAKA
jgi:chaperonin GroEL